LLVFLVSGGVPRLNLLCINSTIPDEVSVNIQNTNN
jgi:hypothetical protein